VVIQPTPYPDVNEILNLLLTAVKEILKDQFIGMYLFGSLANGGFDKDSDIDILMVTKDEIAQETFSALYAMHEKISTIDSPWAFQLEVSYIPKAALRHYDPSNNKHPHLDRDKDERLHIVQHDQDWIIQRYLLRERGVIVAGPSPQTLIDPVSSNDLKQAIVDILPLWFNPILDNPSKIRKSGYQSYFVLSICRVFYTLKHGEIVSKRVAAEWGKKNLDPRWTPLIERAEIGRQDPDQHASPDDINGTLDMMRDALNVILSGK
jgi:predicted nucleotidyltransferase